MDNLSGAAGNDTFNGTLISPPGASTLSVLDSIDGGDGTDTLNISDNSGGLVLPASIALTKVETVNVVSADGVGFGTPEAERLNVSGLASVTTLNVTRSYGANYIKVGTGQAVNVSGAADGKAVDIIASTGAVSVIAAGAVTVAGGSTQTVSTKGGVTLSLATGAISVTDTAQGTANSTVDDGTSASVTNTVALVSGSASSTGKVTIGSSTTKPTGAVSVNETIVGLKSADKTAGDITVNGGTTVSVTQSATQAIATQSTTAGQTTTNYSATQAAVSVNASAMTTAVTVKQSPAVAKVDSVTAKAGV